MRITTSIPILVLLLISAGCTRKSKITEPALAKVGSTVLTKAEAREAIPSHLFERDSLAAYTRYREDWINHQILLQEAYRLRVHRQSDVVERLTKIREDYIAKAAQEYILNELNNDLTVTDEEARTYYQMNKDNFVLEERYIRFRHVVASSQENAENAKEDLLKGIEWEVVAQNFSVNPEKAITNSEKFWPESIAATDIPSMNRYLGVIGISEISPTQQIGDEFHFVQLLEQRDKGEHPDLEWLIVQIKDWLLLEKRRVAFNTYVKNLYLQAQANNEIETFDVTE